MKKTTRLIFLTVFVCSILTGCASVKPDEIREEKANKQEYSPGTRTETEYTSKWIGLKYTLPSNMVMTTDDEINTRHEMSASNMTNHSNIIIAVEKLTLSAITEEQYIEALKAEIAQLGMKITFNDNKKRIIAGIEFSEMSCTTELYGVAINQIMLLKKMNDHIVRVTVTYLDQATLDSMLAGFSAY